MIQALTTLIIIFCYTTLFCLVGIYIFRKIFLLKRLNSFHHLFVLGSAFFIGYTFFLVNWSLLTHITNDAKISLLFTTFLFLIISSFTIFNKKQILNIPKKKWVYLGIFLVTLISIGTFKALIPMPTYVTSEPACVNSFAGFGGVVHSFRAGNLSQFIFSENYFPNINQHSGQSILASIPLFISNPTIQLSLVIWLNIFIGFFAFTIYGLTRFFTSKPIISLIPLVAVMFGNTVLSPFYSSITDTESVLILASNIDSIFGIVTFLLLIILAFFFVKKEARSNWFLFILISFGFAWNITSGQMIILFIAIITISLYFFKNLSNIKNILFWNSIIFFTSAILGMFVLGGMLTPTKYTDEIDVPGMMKVQNNNVPISMHFPRTNEGNPQTKMKLQEIFVNPKTTLNSEEVNTEANNPSSQTINKIKGNDLLFKIAKIVRSVQLVFFPLLGIFLSFYLIKFSRKIIWEDELFIYLTQITTLTFFIGWIVSSIFELYGYSWELSKFFYLGAFLSMYILGLSMTLIFINYTKQIYRYIILLIILLIVAGPTLEYFARTFGNIYLQPQSMKLSECNFSTEQSKPLNLSKRLEFLIQSNGYYGNK